MEERNKRRTYFSSGHAEGRLEVLGHAEGNSLGNAQTLAFLEADIVIDVNDLKTKTATNF